MSILEIGPLTDGHQTNSADIQRALNRVGEKKEYEAVHFAKGTYIIDDPGVDNPLSVLAINNGSKVFGDLDAKGNPTTVFMLMDNAPLKPFGCGVPIIGPASKVGQNIEFCNFTFNGNNPIGDGSSQKPSTDAMCPGTNGRPGSNYGKGFHNFIGAYTGGFKDCSFHDITIFNSAGDGFRANRFTASSGLEFYNWNVTNCGHCCIMVENTTNVKIRDCKLVTRSNGGIRSQNGCSDIEIKNVQITGTPNDYNPGMQITGDRILITYCRIQDTLGPGIEVAGADNTDIRIRKNIFENCGLFPCTGDCKIPGVGGIVINGAHALIDENLFIDCKGYGIGAAVYSPDGRSFSKSGFEIHARNNIIVNTSPANYPGEASGIAIANLFYNDSAHKHKLIGSGNVFYPNVAGKRLYCVDYEDPIPEISTKVIDVLQSNYALIIPRISEAAATSLLKAINDSGLLTDDEKKNVVVSALGS